MDPINLSKRRELASDKARAREAQPALLDTASAESRVERPDLIRLASFLGMHAGCLAVFWVGGSIFAIACAFFLYVVRAFGLTAFYHRYFAHRAFRTSRWFQFCGGLLGCLALQKGPLWWAGHHRQHHRTSDRVGDLHSPHIDTFLWSHMGWFLTHKNNRLRSDLIGDWISYPELRWLDRLAPLVALLYGVTLYVTGEALRRWLPQWQTNGPMLFVWGFFVSTVFLYHVTYAVNSFAHLYGTRRYETLDDSRNNWWVALLTLGEGWHNNHHRYPSSARQGFFWWEIDVTYYALVILSRCGLVWRLRRVPEHVLRETPKSPRSHAPLDPSA